MNCFVWRVPLPDECFTNGKSKFEFVRDELIKKKILRQGWGIENLGNGESVYVARYVSLGGIEAEAKKRFQILSPMLDIAVGDKIVIPKLSIRSSENVPGKYFTVVVCTKVYDFCFPYIGEWDFGHFVQVDNLTTYDNSAQPYISEQLKDYKKAINRVRNPNVTNAIP